MTLIHARRDGPCPVCGDQCVGVPDIPYPSTYPFLPGGYDPRSPDMPDDVIVTERIFDSDGNLVATPGDRIKAEDAQKWQVGPDGRMQVGNTVAEPVPEHAEKHPTARTRVHGRGQNR